MTPRLTPLDPWIASKIGTPGQAVARAALDAYQLACLQATLNFAVEKSRFYREHMPDAPRELHSLADLARLPFTSAEDIRRQPLSFVCVSQGDIHRVVTLDTSGTTGTPKRLYFTRDDQALTVDFFHTGMSTFTDPGDRVLILLPCERPGSVGDLLAVGLQRLGAAPIKHGPVRDMAQALSVLRGEGANGLVGIPTQVLALARYSPGLKIKSVLLSTDHVPEALRHGVEQAWRCRVFNHYGMTEMGLGGGVECEARRGYHLREADMYFEVVNPVSGEPVADGEMGEVVFTTLTRQGMPLVRYRTGDLSRFVPGDCPCGTRLKTLEWVRQRAGGPVLDNGAPLSLADLDEVLFAVEGVFDFSAALTRSAAADCLNVTLRAVESAAGMQLTVIREALLAIPGLRAACATGRLKVEVSVQTGPAVPRPAKRQIADRRTTGQGAEAVGI